MRYSSDVAELDEKLKKLKKHKKHKKWPTRTAQNTLLEDVAVASFVLRQHSNYVRNTHAPNAIK